LKLGLSTYTYTWSIGVPEQLPVQPMTPFGLLDRSHQLGVHLVQMADNLPLDQLTPEMLDLFEARLKDLGITVEVGTRGIAPEHLRRYLGLAERFGSPILRVVIDTAEHHPSPAEVCEILTPMQPEFERTGIILAIENHDRFPASVLASLVRQLGSWTGVCLDTVNSFGALEGPQIVVDVLGPLTVNLHIKDFTVFRASHMMGFMVEGRPAGQGRLDIPWLLSELKEQRRDPNGILELWTPQVQGETLENTIEREGRWAEESVTYLRTLIPV
jgi:sugar phosphate isomerase/epimerase